MKRWLVALLLAVFCVHTLPVLELGKHACALLADDAMDAEDEGGTKPIPTTQKNVAAAGWCGVEVANGAARLQHDEQVAVALHDAAMRLPRVDSEVVVPPPDAVV